LGKNFVFWVMFNFDVSEWQQRGQKLFEFDQMLGTWYKGLLTEQARQVIDDSIC